MKLRKIIFYTVLITSTILHSCNPLSTIRIETIVPADIDFPGNYNQIVFINMATDINHDEKIDTLLYNIITQEMSLGFMDAVKFSAGVDTTSFLYVRGYPNKSKLYQQDTISWKYLTDLTQGTNADIFVVLDSMRMSMTSDSFTEYYSVPVEYYRYRELSVNIYWSVFDLIEKKRLDRYNYIDTLYWERMSYLKSDLESKMPSVERSIRETSYFAAADYANRIFPGWKSENRYYFHLGNQDFEKAADLVQKYNWQEAITIWENYIDDIDKEIASRACFNLAFANEMLGKLDLAIAWAEQSKKIKNKSRTRYYISMLKSRQTDLKKLDKQIY
ncbi:MAG: hypothetical protein C0597_12795 [Marinilabiliales bacterium]|nr:MAG: hypothetical protein C0597_12795 [Marinilabiliales bacterium]